LTDFQKLREELEKIKKNPANEFKFKPIEKWMKEELGVVRIKKGTGSHVTFYHRVFEPRNGTGHFTIALKKNKILYKRNFLEYTYKDLKDLINLIEEEANREK